MVWLFMLAAFWPLGLWAAAPDYQLPINKGTVISIPVSQDIAVGGGEVADIKLLDPTHLYVMGNKLGTGRKSDPMLWNHTCRLYLW